MDSLKKACLSIAAIAILAVVVTAKFGTRNEEPLCDGRRYALSTTSNGASPYIGLSADGVFGQFLLDYGATKRSLSASAFAASGGPVKNVAISLPGFKGGSFVLRRYDLPLQPDAGQLGVIGSDFLSLLSVQFTGGAAFLGTQPCQSNALRARGLVPIAQSGFFTSDPSRIDGKHPNVPVVFLGLGDVHTWAQIDTVYDDVLYANSVDINEDLFERLTNSGAAFDHLADISVSTCDGSESRHVYALKDRPLVIETDQAAPIARIETYHLILKPVNGCGGIAAMAIPAAQLGASFLRIFGTVVFDPRSETVWLEGHAKEQKSGLWAGVW